MTKLLRSPSTILVVIFLLLQFLGAIYQNRVLSRSFSSLDNKINTLDQKITVLAPAANDSVITALGTLRDELVKYRAEQVGRDQILGLMNSDASDTTEGQDYSSLSTTLDQAIATIERQTGTTPTPTATPSKTLKATLKPGWKTVDVYEKPQASSRVVGQISTGQFYPILSEQTTWFQLSLTSNLSGWVQSQFINETNN